MAKIKSQKGAYVFFKDGSHIYAKDGITWEYERDENYDKTFDVSEQWFKANLDIGVKKGPNVKFSIIHNMESESEINGFYGALGCWVARITDNADVTAKGFCDYINSKGCWTALTMEEFQSIVT